MVELRQGRVGAIEKLSKFKKPSANHKTKPKEEYTHWDYLLMEMVHTILTISNGWPLISTQISKLRTKWPLNWLDTVSKDLRVCRA